MNYSLYKLMLFSAFIITPICKAEVDEFSKYKAYGPDLELIFKGKMPEEIKQIMDCLTKSAGECRSGYLFYGATGNGKRALAETIARNAESIFFQLPSWFFLSKNRQVDHAKIDRFFDAVIDASKDNPVVIDIDYFDALCFNKAYYYHTKEDIVNDRNSAVEHFIKRINTLPKNVVFIAVSNKPHLLNERLFNTENIKPVEIGYPNYESRIEILKYYAEKYNLKATEEKIAEIARNSKNFLPVDLKQVARDASIYKNEKLDNNALQIGYLQVLKHHVSYRKAANKQTREEILIIENNKTH